MRAHTLLMSTILCTGLTVGFVIPTAEAQTITSDTAKTATSPISKEASSDMRVAATGFIEHVNYARVALAMKNSTLAMQHINQAKTIAALIKTTGLEQSRITEVQTGRIIYTYDTDYKYHYFPIETGPVQVKKMSSGMMWAKNELAVTDADIVYLTLDLRGDKTEKYLSEAEEAISVRDFKKADSQLATLTNAVVSTDSKTSVPGDKAHDNIALARHFINAKNYDGARFALKHADDAMDEMQKDDKNKPRNADLMAMRKDVAQLQTNITAKDPTMIEKTNAKMEKWWDELKEWNKNRN